MRMIVKMKRIMTVGTAVWVNLLAVAGAALAQQSAGSESDRIAKVAVTQLDTAKKLIDILIEFFVKYSFQVLGGIIVLAVGWYVAKYLADLACRLLDRYRVDVTVKKFVSGAVKLGIMTFAVIVALGKFGIEVAPLIAGISVAGLGVSFALQGPLSNYASGATLIFTKPFKVGDIIEVVGVAGEVMDMKLSRTEIKTVDDTLIVIPNKHIVGEIIHNYSNAKRLDVNVGVSYSSDIDRAIEIVREVLRRDQRIVRESNVGISQFADSSINIYGRAWCKQDDYWKVLFDVHRSILGEFKKNGIEIPFPQRDVRLLKET